jgi:hypothetical protein
MKNTETSIFGYCILLSLLPRVSWEYRRIVANDNIPKKLTEILTDANRGLV